jgi:hypothetical protein
MKLPLRYFFIAIFIFSSVVYAQERQEADKTKPQSSDSAQPPISKIGDNLYQLGTITLDSKKRELRIPGTVNMQKGVIEVLACAPGGKVHESVLVLDVVPYHLQVALLLLGLQYVGGLEYQGDPRTPQGDSVEVWVSWKDGTKEVTVRGEEMVWDVVRNTTMEQTPWIFVGSKMNQGTFMADLEKSLITTYHDPFTILDNPLTTGSNDELYRVNEQLVPPKGTPVTVTLKPIR